MPSLTEQEICFLVALSASEESSFIELKWEFQKWNHNGVDVTAALERLIRDGTILLYVRKGESFCECSVPDSLRLAATWSTSESRDTLLVFTDAGEQRWKEDDWGITTEQARGLMYSNQGHVRRV